MALKKKEPVWIDLDEEECGLQIFTYRLTFLANAEDLPAIEEGIINLGEVIKRERLKE